MEKTRDWILVIGVLLILGLGVFVAISVLVTLKNTAEQAVAPVNALGTQAAEILNPTPTILPDPPKNPSFKPEDVDLTVPLNRRQDDNRQQEKSNCQFFSAGIHTKSH